MKTLILDPGDYISILDFLTTYRLVCDAKRFREGVAMWAMLQFVAGRVTLSLNSRMVQWDGTKGIATTVSSNSAALQDPRSFSYPKVENHLLKWYTCEENINKADATISGLTQPTSMTPQQYDKAIFAKAIRVEEIYDEGTLNDTIIEGSDGLICHCLRVNWATQPHADLTDLAFQGHFILFI